MKAWWSTFGGQIRIQLKSEDRQFLEEQTGCIPYILRSLLRAGPDLDQHVDPNCSAGERYEQLISVAHESRTPYSELGFLGFLRTWDVRVLRV
jgi:hypothetical protein